MSKLFADGTEMSKLLEHAEVIAHSKVLDNFRLFQAKAMDMLDREFPASGSQSWSMQREDLGEVAEVRARQSDLAHHSIVFLYERVYLKKQIRKSAAPSADNVLNDSPNVGILDTEIGELRGKELVYPFDFSVIPKFLEVALDAFLVGAISHEHSSNYSAQHTPARSCEGTQKFQHLGVPSE